MPADAGPRVGGLQRFTSLDYPGKLAAVVFVQGCPWRCGYCHNPQLQPRHHVAGPAAGPAWADVQAWLCTRTGLLDAVVFSGGEPSIDPGLAPAMAQVRALGFAVGLHSAGIHPRRLAEVLPQVDWIGLDVKAPLDDDALHDRVTGIPGSADAARRSLHAVLASGVDHEVRTTWHGTLLDDAALLRLADGLAAAGVRHYALQVARGTAAMAGSAPPAEHTLAALRARFPRFTLRSG